MGELQSLNFDSFPTEMLTEFLLRLTVRDLASATLTCKAWCSTISKPEFVDLHLKHSAKCPVYLYHSSSSKVEYFLDSQTISLGIDEKIAKPQKIGVGLRDGLKPYMNSSGGLLAYTLKYEKICYVCNPFTGHEIKVAMGPLWDEKGFDTNWCGLGYSGASKEYKIILLAKKIESQVVCKCVIHTLGLGSEWRDIPCDIPFGICNISNHHALEFEGSLFWLVFCSFSHGPKFIASFDVELESFKLWKSPPNANMHVELSRSCQMISSKFYRRRCCIIRNKCHW